MIRNCIIVSHSSLTSKYCTSTLAICKEKKNGIFAQRTLLDIALLHPASLALSVSSLYRVQLIKRDHNKKKVNKDMRQRRALPYSYSRAHTPVRGMKRKRQRECKTVRTQSARSYLRDAFKHRIRQSAPIRTYIRNNLISLLHDTDFFSVSRHSLPLLLQQIDLQTSTFFGANRT